MSTDNFTTMKKLFLTTALILCSIASMAQVKFFNGTFEEALAKAKEVNKPLLVLVTTPNGWGPCALLERDVFPSKIAGDFINDKVIFLKYSIDGKSNNAFVDELKVKRIPTYIFYNGNGEEFLRKGAETGDIKGFQIEISNALKPENSFVEMEKRFKNEPSYACEYLTFFARQDEQAKCDSLLNIVFPKLTTEEKFSKEWLEYYNIYIQTLNSIVFKYMLENQKVASKIMGKVAFEMYMKDKAISVLEFAIYMNENNNLKENIAIINKNPIMASGFTKFVDKNFDNIVNNDIPAIYNYIEKELKNLGSKTRNQILSLINYKLFDKNSIDKYLKIFEEAIKYEEDNRIRQEHEDHIEQLNRRKQEYI